MSKITDKVYELAKPVVEQAGCSLWDVEYVREAGSWYPTATCLKWALPEQSGS